MGMYQSLMYTQGERVRVNLGANVVKTLMAPYRNTYRHIYSDNFFASIELLIDILKLGLYGCGTVRTNRKGFPDELKTLAKEGLGERGKSKKFQHDNVTATVWQNNKLVPVKATNGDPTVRTEVHRKNKDGSRAVVPCPESVINIWGGVDRNDQLRGYYNVCLKCRKFYKYIFWFLFDIYVTNSYILFRQYIRNPDKCISDLKTFRVKLARSLIADYCSRKRPGRPSLIKRFCQADFPVRGAEKGRRCFYCYTYNHVRHERVWYCKDCNRFLCHNGTASCPSDNKWGLTHTCKHIYPIHYSWYTCGTPLC